MSRPEHPHLLVPAIYVSNVTSLKPVVRVSRVLDAVHVQYRAPDRYDYEAVKRALLWG